MIGYCDRSSVTSSVPVVLVVVLLLLSRSAPRLWCSFCLPPFPTGHAVCRSADCLSYTIPCLITTRLCTFLPRRSLRQNRTARRPKSDVLPTFFFRSTPRTQRFWHAYKVSCEVSVSNGELPKAEWIKAKLFQNVVSMKKRYKLEYLWYFYLNNLFGWSFSLIFITKGKYKLNRINKF